MQEQVNFILINNKLLNKYIYHGHFKFHIVIGSNTSNAGTIIGETITPNRTWTVRINGANYKIPLLAI
jgi:2-keto-4-pentenoate hydratase